MEEAMHFNLFYLFFMLSLNCNNKYVYIDTLISRFEFFIFIRFATFKFIVLKNFFRKNVRKLRVSNKNVNTDVICSTTANFHMPTKTKDLNINEKKQSQHSSIHINE